MGDVFQSSVEIAFFIPDVSQSLLLLRIPLFISFFFFFFFFFLGR